MSEQDSLRGSSVERLGGMSNIDESSERTVVLSPDTDRAARVAIKAYVSCINDEDVAEELLDMFELSLSEETKWEQHNSSFSYTPPEKPAYDWTEGERQHLFDRVINRRVEWFCSCCSGNGPISSLEKARRHVVRNHGSEMLDKYEVAEEVEESTDEMVADGGIKSESGLSREEENHTLTDF